MLRTSLICVWNNREVLDNTLLSSVDRQSGDLEIILLDNRSGKYTSCAAALNAGAAMATGEYLAFVHQDVAFASRDELSRAVNLVARLPDCGVAGPAGAIRRIRGRGKGSQMFGQIRQGPPPGELTLVHPLSQPMPVVTLDELLLIIPRAVFQQWQFDPTACPDWHLYGVEYCLSVARHELRPYAIAIDVRHQSSGTLSEGYFHTLSRVSRKHLRCITIPTTCGNWLTFVPPRWQWELKEFLKRRRNRKG